MRLGVEENSRRVWAIFLALTLLALVIRLAWLDRKSLWLDEVYTLHHVTQSVAEIVEAPPDPHPPLFYVWMHYWIGLGTSEFVLRLPSALFGAASVGLLYLVGRRWGNEWIGIASALLLLMAPLHVWLSQDARMYASTCFLGLVAILALGEAVMVGRTTALLGWIAATVLGLYTSVGTIAFLALQMLLLLPACYWAGVSWRRLLPVVLALAAVILLYAPWALRPGNEVEPTLNVIAPYFDQLSRSLAALGVGVSNRQLLFIVGVLGVVGVVLSSALSRLVIAEWSRWNARAETRRTWLAIFAVGLYVIALVVEVWPVGYRFRRQVLIFFPYFLLAVVWSISKLKLRNQIVGALSVVTLPFMIATLAVIQQQDWRALAQFLETRADSRDIILISSSYYDQTLEYYYRGSTDYVGVAGSDVPQRLERLTQGKERIWLILCGDWDTDPQGKIPPWLNAQRSPLESFTFPGIQLQLYGPSETGAPP